MLDAVVAAYDSVGKEHAALYHDLLAGGLPEAALKYLEERMTLTGTYEYKTEFARTHFSRGKAEGEVRGEAKALLRVLARRGIDLPVRDRERITRCGDLEQLETWLDRAATATSIEDVLDA